MRFRCLKAFTGHGVKYERGAEVDLAPSVKIQGLIEQRYLLPIDAELAEVTQSPAAITEAGIVARRKAGRPAKEVQS